MDEIILNFFEGLDWWGKGLFILLELVCAGVFAGLIGYERETHGHSAGLRTHILVSIGACLIMNISISAPGLEIDGVRDPARLAAQVVSGIGCLGAGTIIQNGTNIKGLTTAATLWLCGGIGLACGSGYFTGAVIATLVSLITLILLFKLEIKVNQRSPRIMLIIGCNSPNVLKDIMELSNTFDINVKDIRSTIVKDKQGNPTCHLTLQLARTSYMNVEAFAEELRSRLNPIDFKLYNK